jgi:F0F1-type ATP synthase membrane subunit b/b'
MRSALNIAHGRLKYLHDDVQLRSSGIAEDEEKLRLEVGAIEADLHRIELCRTRLMEVDTIKAQLHNKLNEILENLKKSAKVSLATIFSDKEYQQANNLKKLKMDFSKFWNYLQQKEYKGTGTMEFQTREEAEKFATLAVSYPKQKAELLLEDVREQIENKIKRSREELIAQLEKDTKPIIEQARKRVNETFNLNLSLPIPTLKRVEMDFVKPNINKDFRMVDQGYETVKRRSWKHWLWIVRFETQVQKPKKRDEYYIVSLQEIVEEFNSLIKHSIENIKQGINQYLDEDFQQRIDTFFNDLDHYLSNYRDSLRQAQSDKKLSVAQQSKLIGEINYIFSEATEYIEGTDTYLKRTDDLMKS